jgi:hypothetical protein
MNLSRARFLSTAAFPIVASLVVLSFADVSQRIWLMHLLLICTACILIAAGQFLDRWTHGPAPAKIIAFLTLFGLAAPLVNKSSGPDRWVSVGPLKLYLAPLLLPSFFAACSVYVRKRGRMKAVACTALVGAGILLAIQPDASQVLALLAGSAVLFMRYRTDLLRTAITLGAIALATAGAFTRPDPLEPVPYVESVFALALGGSTVAGLAVIASAFIFIACLYAYSLRGAAWLAAVAAYYAVLFFCSVAGLTPAPLIGYGAGPLLGFGFMAAVSWWVDPEALPTSSIITQELS